MCLEFKNKIIPEKQLIKQYVEKWCPTNTRETSYQFSLGVLINIKKVPRKLHSQSLKNGSN